MSYILDALKKSEEERQRGNAPTLQTIHTSSLKVRQRRPIWPYLLIGALAANIALLAWWFKPWQEKGSQMAARDAAVEQKEESPQRPEFKPSGKQARLASVEASVVTRAGENSNKETNRKSAGTTPPVEKSHKPAEVPAEKIAAKPSPAVKKNAANKKKPGGSVETKKEPAPAEPSTKVDEVPPKTSAATNKPKDDSREVLTVLKEVANIGEETLGEKSPASPPTDVKPEVPSLKDLPVSLRKEIPRLSLSFLVFAKDPADRMVSVNGQMMREGQEVSSGLKLEEITPDGAIFSFKGRRFHKGIF